MESFSNDSHVEAEARVIWRVPTHGMIKAGVHSQGNIDFKVFACFIRRLARSSKSSIDYAKSQQANDNIVSQNMVKDGAVWLEDKKRALTKDEMAQYLANVSLWTIINQNNVEGAIITQDNLTLRGSLEEMESELKVMLKNIPFGAYVVKLTPSQNKVKYNEHFYYASNLEPDCSAYYITKRGAEKLLGVHKPIRSTIKELMLNFGIISKSAYCVKKPIFIPK